MIASIALVFFHALPRFHYVFTYFRLILSLKLNGANSSALAAAILGAYKTIMLVNLIILYFKSQTTNFTRHISRL